MVHAYQDLLLHSCSFPSPNWNHLRRLQRGNHRWVISDGLAQLRGRDILPQYCRNERVFAPFLCQEILFHQRKTRLRCWSEKDQRFFELLQGRYPLVPGLVHHVDALRHGSQNENKIPRGSLDRSWSPSYKTFPWDFSSWNFVLQHYFWGEIIYQSNPCPRPRFELRTHQSFHRPRSAIQCLLGPSTPSGYCFTLLYLLVNGYWICNLGEHKEILGGRTLIPRHVQWPK